VLQQGGVTLRLPAETHEVTLIVGRIGNGEVFGLSPILGPGQYTTTAVSTEASRILAIEAKPLQLLLEENCLIGMRIMRVLAEAYFSRYIDVLARVQRVVNEIGAH
jgi:CRP-like cAMP-binding protein